MDSASELPLSALGANRSTNVCACTHVHTHTQLCMGTELLLPPQGFLSPPLFDEEYVFI